MTMPGNRLPALLAAALALGFLPVASQAQSIVSSGQSFVSAGLVAGPRTGTGREIGLRLEVAPGWKTYWRSPGEAGVPPEMDWSGSSNVADVTVHWPAPEVFESFGMRTLGYGGTVVLPVTITARDPQSAIALDLDLRLGVCRDICVFEETTLSRTVMPETGDEAGAEIAAAMARVPGPPESVGVTRVDCRITGAGLERGLTAALSFEDMPSPEPIVVVEGSENIWPFDTQAEVSGDAMQVSATLGLASEAVWIDRSAVTLTVLTGNGAAEIRGCSRAAG